MVLSILFFLGVTIGLSFLIDLFIDYRADIVEQFFMRIGFGISAFTILGIFLDFFGIPLHFMTFLIIAFIITISAILKKWKFSFNKWLQPIKSKNNIISYIIVFLMFCVTAYMYISGSFGYPYFENDDPWDYTVVSKVIGEGHTIRAPFKYNHYSEPYTQGYQALMGVIGQTNDSIYWTMKFFTNLIYAFSIPFFFNPACSLGREKC